MDIREKRRALPGSYEDFIDSILECMEQEEDVRTTDGFFKKGISHKHLQSNCWYATYI